MTFIEYGCIKMLIFCEFDFNSTIYIQKDKSMCYGDIISVTPIQILFTFEKCFGNHIFVMKNMQDNDSNHLDLTISV